MNHFIITYASEDDEYYSWKLAFDKTVIYKKYASRWDTNYGVYFDFEIDETYFGGMSMYIPQKYYEDNQLIKQLGWYHAAGYESVGW